jgi:hypothetical protein
VTSLRDEITQLQDKHFNSNAEHENENAKRSECQAIGDIMGQQICLDRMKQMGTHEESLRREIAAKFAELAKGTHV